MAETRCKYYKQKRQVSYDGGVTWQDVIPYEYQKGDLYEYESADCGALVVYRWINMDASTDYYCEGTTKYYKQKRQVSYDGGQTWRDVSPAEYQKGGVAEAQSTDCGYVPPVVQYRWIKSDDTICVETLYRWINMDASTDYYCEGTTKYYKQKQQVSYNEGHTWQDVTPPVYQKGDVAEAQSTDCGYVPPTPPTGDLKWKATYADGSVVSAECGSSSEIVMDEISLTNLISVEIGDCVTTIGDFALEFCESLTSVTIPNSVTDIGSAAFDYCTNLPEITLPTGITHIGMYQFRGCESLTSVTIPNTVRYISTSAFESCYSLTSITIPDSVTHIYQAAFMFCSGLTSVTIPSSVTNIYNAAFTECTSLTDITCLATTPPTISGDPFSDECIIYVPCESVELYKSTGQWSIHTEQIKGIPPCAEPVYENEFTFSNHSTSYHVTAGGAGESFNIDIISYVNGVKTDSYSLVEKTTWIQYDSHTAESFSITVGWNSTSRRRSGYITLRQDQTNKEITLDVTQL